MAKKEYVIIKRSKMVEEIIDILKQEGFIDAYQKIEDKQSGKIKIYLKCTAQKESVLENLSRISTPGRRVYIKASEIKAVRGGVGVAVLSTNKGIMIDRVARAQGVGGEVICHIW
ncbi:Ribosomal protein S8 [Candidatus Omnitrophus magneticus]|uniref:Small ribosomal subunit protein uS8 n=1 Tax=Candidatus Omnitrophus magneticus TaxID=1609969 RepID=A0A0F0CM70_9BACT|nr:Ribosomal protein S8 [Candidatus Omnitrophus magneticus]